MIWDYIIVGAGSAGCALAHELVTANAKVLLLEAGGSDRSPFIRIPAGAIRAEQVYDWGYRSQPDPTCNGATEAWTRGRVLGGSSSINSTVFVRGAARDFDRWADTLEPSAPGAAGWSSQQIMTLFRDIENSDQSGAHRGQSGPLHVRTVKSPHSLSKEFVESARACGHAFNEDYNGERQGGVSYAQFSQRRGLRCSSSDAFLRPLLARKNLTLVLKAWVQRIEFNSARAIAVTFTQKGKIRRETAHDIVICGGAINSPQLLMLSGIGDPVELGRHGIKVNVDLPGVGRNLQEHPSLRLLYRTRVPSYNLTEGWRQKIGIAAKYLATHEGPIANIFESVAFLRTSQSEAHEDIQLHFGAMGHEDTRGSFGLAPFPSVSVVVNKSYPQGRGRIRLADRNPESAPLIECRLLGAEADVDTLARGLVLVREIMQAEPIASRIEREIRAGSAVKGSAAIKTFIRENAKTTYHPVGTCRMGTDKQSVVGPDLRVRGVDNLWIADASIMPDLISGNTNAACMMIGAKLGKQLVASR